MGLLENLKNFFFNADEEAARPETGRNEPCWCGSGRKYKKCHLADDEKKLAKKHEAACAGNT
ncbi:MAG: SEC-C metal-binding domain-containing protein [Nitrospiraceae bacterium]|nr:SEC-C metal-binding domain-containing protein [Nitrospiraceae bacterium]